MDDEPKEGILTDAQKAGFTDAFTILDKQQQGYIPFSEFGTLFRSVGQNPTETDIRAIIQEHDTAGTQHFDLDKFLKICESDWFKDPMNDDHLIEAFRMYDKDGKGMMSVPMLRYMLQCMGETLTDEEADDFIDFADKEKLGEVNYEQLVKDLLDRDPGPLACM
eukprot:GEMP01046504.1.p1 GENE.GEMP01046504.1~~GEMP01046504.1.p1  ORF type:complete len:164 (+),score=45.65 GEMP01046504.1:162-653(+)